MRNNRDINHNRERNFKWKELLIRIDHYRFYLKVALQANAFFYVIAGAVLGFYLNEPHGNINNPAPNQPPVETHRIYFFWLPILIGTVLGAIFIVGAQLQNEAADIIEEIRRELIDSYDREVKRIPDVNLLHILLLIFGSILFLVVFAMITIPLLPGFPNFEKHQWIFLGGALAMVVPGLGLTLFYALKLKKEYKERIKKKYEQRRALAPPTDKALFNSVAIGILLLGVLWAFLPLRKNDKNLKERKEQQ